VNRNSTSPTAHPNSGVPLCCLTVKALSVEDSPEASPESRGHRPDALSEMGESRDRWSTPDKMDDWQLALEA
jgi:hypothetical protein